MGFVKGLDVVSISVHRPAVLCFSELVNIAEGQEVV